VVVRHVNGSATLVEGNAAGLDLTHPDPADPAATVMHTGHAFINDMAHSASPVSDFGVPLTPDADLVPGGTPAPGFYDNELLDAHYAAGDGRVNENVGLTAIHDIFHSEHNRLVQQIEGVIQAELNNGDTSFASDWVLAGVSLGGPLQELHHLGCRPCFHLEAILARPALLRHRPEQGQLQCIHQRSECPVRWLLHADQSRRIWNQLVQRDLRRQDLG
jgi:hypothetical protein